MPTGWDSILTVISFGDCYTDGLEMLLHILGTKKEMKNVEEKTRVWYRRMWNRISK